MKTALKVLAVVVVLSVALLGCSQSGFLTVENNTAGPVDVSVNGDDETIDAGDDMGWEYEFPGFVLNLIKQETESVDIEYAGMFVFYDEDTVEVEAGDDITFEIDADGGAIVVQNSSSRSLDYVWIKPAASSTWSENLVENSSIGPGQGRYWTVSSGGWNVDVYDSGGFYPSSLPQNDVAINMARTFTWTDSSWTFMGVQGAQILGRDLRVQPPTGLLPSVRIQAGAE